MATASGARRKKLSRGRVLKSSGKHGTIPLEKIREAVLSVASEKRKRR